MTIDDLVAEVWFDLPPIRKRIAGRDTVRSIVVDAIQEWSPEYLMACNDNTQRAVYAADLTKRLEQRYAQQEYGFAIMTIILVAVISAVVQWLVKWWLDRHFNRECMAQWQRELAA